MATLPPVNQCCTKGLKNGLHRAVFDGLTKCIDALLASGIDINEGESNGLTPLMIAAVLGHSRVTTHLLDRGADVSRVADGGFTALHISAGTGNLAITDMLMTAGANLEARSNGGDTPLHEAMTRGGHLEVTRAMVKAGVDVDSRAHNGETPLYMAAMDGLMDIVEVLLGANANPLLTIPNTLPGGPPMVPLDAAAAGGHATVVRRMIGQLGIEGCGGTTLGVSALYEAATKQRFDVMVILVGAGVVDNGFALVGAAACGVQASVKFLLQQHDKKKHTASSGAYVNSSCNISGASPLHYGMGFGGHFSTRIVRMLVDAGADTTSRVKLRNNLESRVIFDVTPLVLVASLVSEKEAEGGEAAEKQLRELEAIRRVLLCVEAARALSWLWPSNSIPCTSDSARAAAVLPKVTSSTGKPLAGLSLISRRRAARHRVLLTALSRYSWKPCPGCA